MHTELLNKSPLGKNSSYIDKYDKSLLFPIARATQRSIEEAKLPFIGWDIWNAYEISWLNEKGKPEVTLAEFILPFNSVNLIESKSLKLYLNSFNNEKFSSSQQVLEIIKNDLTEAAGSPVKIRFHNDINIPIIANFSNAKNIDSLDIETDLYQAENNLLKTNDSIVSESLCSNLLKSNCPVTGQPDWASVLVQYKGKQIDHSSLLKYIISFRNYQEFHEQCVEKIFLDIMDKCQPELLTVYARYTRRGGLDINPIRTNDPNYKPDNSFRVNRQ
jgi:7-cyano-7-deazaguanine reductase